MVLAVICIPSLIAPLLAQQQGNELGRATNPCLCLCLDIGQTFGGSGNPVVGLIALGILIVLFILITIASASEKK